MKIKSEVDVLAWRQQLVATGSARFKPSQLTGPTLTIAARGATSLGNNYRAGYMVPRKRRGSWASKSLARGVGLTSMAVLFGLLVLPATGAVAPVSAEEMPVSAVEEVCHTYMQHCIGFSPPEPRLRSPYCRNSKLRESRRPEFVERTTIISTSQT